MIDSVDRFHAGVLELAKLAEDLRGLLGAVDLHGELVSQWWVEFAPIDMELELRTEAWAPPGAASDEDLQGALARFQDWARAVLAATDNERS